MTQITFQVEQDVTDGGYVAEAYVTENEHIVTQGDTVEELKLMIKEALECHFENPLEIPKTVILNFVRQEIFAI
jgi:predicted RNase H-like HicB family nuclease